MTSQKLEFETTLGLDELSLGQDGEILRFIVGAKHELHLIVPKNRPEAEFRNKIP